MANDPETIDPCAALAPKLDTGFITYAVLLDGKKRVRGYRLAWRPASQHGEPSAIDNLKALVSCIARNLNDPKAGWRMGELLILLDVTAEGLLLDEWQTDLPPKNFVLCMGLDELMDEGTRAMLLLLRAKGFGVMLRGAASLPEDPEIRAIVTHVDVVDGHAELVASIQSPSLGAPAFQPIATRMASWQDFGACAARRVDVLVDGRGALSLGAEAGVALQPEAMLIIRLMQVIRRNEDVRVIEAALKHDPVLTYRLLRYINSPGMGIGVEIKSIRHAVAMFGYSPLFRWLALLLATSNKGSSAFMTRKAIKRGRFVELMGQGTLPPDEADSLFVAGMFSLIDKLLGASLEEVLDKVQLSEAIQLAILKREGLYGPFITLAECCEIDASEAAQLAESLFMSSEKVNAANLLAMAWTQNVNLAEMAD
ncbi:EAL and HDOD domain-containing protein [Variovorax ginsengisoli]|uniref:HDOD domain-containing protein n=1 Tax=Variovorax ginsengisoli TaxID=363844 RepID=A0ABT8S571_9BURK|nr:HDOD domain-containing protein [Variovorax ginsengisoli]MDN8614900.1 HDOD domain-containing protein [Variovorax ginsengisoli]MDO1534070.1 HDOD domain-containing protein [Variovorax ginsengisoli]